MDSCWAKNYMAYITFWEIFPIQLLRISFFIVFKKNVTRFATLQGNVIISISRKETTGKIFEKELLASKYQKGVQVSRKECREWYTISLQKGCDKLSLKINMKRKYNCGSHENWFHLDIFSFDMYQIFYIVVSFLKEGIWFVVACCWLEHHS